MRQLLIDGFNDLHGVCGSTATFGSSTVNCLTDEETIFEDLELGGISEEIDGALQLLKDDFTVIPDAGDKFTFDGKQFRVARVQTDFADPILTVAYTFLQDIATNSKQGIASITISSSATASTHRVNSASASAAIAITATGSATTTSTISASASAAIALSTVAYAALQSVTSSSGSAAITIGATGTATTTSTNSASGSAAIAISASGIATTTATTSASGSAAITIGATGTATTTSTTSATASAAIAISATGSATTHNETSATGSAAIAISATGSATTTQGYSNSYSIELDGSNDHIDADNFNPNSQIGTGAFTMSMWMKTDSTSNQIFWYMGDGGTNNMMRINYLASSGGFKIWATSGGTWTNQYPHVNISTSTDTWYHVAVVRSSTTVTLYVNGTNSDSKTHASLGTGFGNGSAHWLGRYWDGSARLDGHIDEYALWDEALTSSEIEAIYNSGAPFDLTSDSGNYASSANLIGYWRFEDNTVSGSGGYVADSSSNSNTLQLFNGVTFSTDTP